MHEPCTNHKHYDFFCLSLYSQFRRPKTVPPKVPLFWRFQIRDSSGKTAKELVCNGDLFYAPVTQHDRHKGKRWVHGGLCPNPRNKPEWADM